MEQREGFAQNLQKAAERQFSQYLFVGWHSDDKWLMTVSPKLDKLHMTALRDWLTRQIEAEPRCPKCFGPMPCPDHPDGD